MDYLFNKVIKARFLSLFLALLLSACIRDGDFKKLQTQQIGGWTYETSIDKEGQPRSIASNQIRADETGINVILSFQCNNNSNLGLLIETFIESGQKAAPIKMRYAKSAFGGFSVADIKAYNNQATLNWMGTKTGNKSNSIFIELVPRANKKEKELKRPTLKLSIPTITSPRDVTIKLNNPKIQKVFSDCQFKPAFLTSK